MVIYCLLSSEILHDSVDNTVHNYSEEHREQSAKPPILNEQCFRTQTIIQNDPSDTRVMIFHSHERQNQISASLLQKKPQIKTKISKQQQNNQKNQKEKKHC